MATDLTNIPPDFKVLASGVPGPEGPAIDSQGRLHLVSAEDASIIRVSNEGEITQIAKTEGRPNGLVFNSEDEMFVADAELKAILRFRSNGDPEVFVDQYEGTALGGPNDLCFLPNGDLLFTDPIRRPQPDPAISPVYRVTPKGNVSAFANDLAYPNSNLERRQAGLRFRKPSTTACLIYHRRIGATARSTAHSPFSRAGKSRWSGGGRRWKYSPIATRNSSDRLRERSGRTARPVPRSRLGASKSGIWRC